MDLKPGGLWLPEPRCQWPEWAEPFKNALYANRRTELVFIGQDMPEADIRRALDEILVTDEEFAQGPDLWHGWMKLVQEGRPHAHDHHGH